MALWNTIQRLVMLKANEMNAADASTLASTYSVAAIGQTELNDRAIEFPFNAINDALLEAGGRIVERIGLNPISPYRSYFQDQTDSISDGGRIPEVSQAGHPRVGVLGAVYDGSSGEECEFVPRQVVKGAGDLSLKVSPHFYNTDQQRIWHTRTTVVADIVIWEAQVERYWMESSPRGICPFPDATIKGLVDGALAEVFRGAFNIEQAHIYQNRFDGWLATL